VNPSGRHLEFRLNYPEFGYPGGNQASIGGAFPCLCPQIMRKLPQAKISQPFPLGSEVETVPGPRLGLEKEPERWGIGSHSP
jgi:hypothetical protein